MGSAQNYLDTLFKMEEENFMQMPSNPHRDLSSQIVFKNFIRIIGVLIEDRYLNF